MNYRSFNGQTNGGARARGGPAVSVAARALTALCVSVTVSYGVLIYAYAVVLLPMQHALAITRAEAGLALSIALLVSAAAAFPVGRWLDRRSPRLLLTSGSSLAAASLAAWSQVTQLWQLYAVFAVMGLAMGTVLYPAAFALLAKLYWPFPRRAMTTVTVFGGLAALVFTPSVQAMSSGAGWRTTLLVLSAITVLLCVVPHALLLPGRLATDHLTAAGTVGPVNASVPAREAIRGVAFWALTAALFIAYFISIGLAVHLIPLLTERRFTPAFAALAAGLLGGMQIAGRALLLPLERRLPRAAITTGAFALQALLLSILAGQPGAALLIVFVISFGMVRGLVPLLGATLLADFYGPAEYGAISGLMGVFTAVAQACAPGGVGALYDSFHGYEAALWVMVAGAAVATIAAHIAEHTNPHHEARPCAQ